MTPDRPSAPQRGHRDRFHEIRRALNGAVLQIEVARLEAERGSSPESRALATAADQLVRLSDAVDALEKDITGS